MGRVLAAVVLSVALMMVAACQRDVKKTPVEYENTIARLCLKNGQILWPNQDGSARCPDWFHLKWPNRTVKVYIPANAREVMTIKAAMEGWNKALGWELFVRSGQEEANLHLFPLSSCRPGLMGYTALVHVDGRNLAGIGMCPGWTAMPYKLMMHELGHVLGLLHDRGNILSLMYPYIHHGPMPPSQADIDALQKLYF